MPVIVVPYSPDWPAQFERIAAELRPALTGVPVIAIEHVGSTSVPGLAAKPIIDIDILVDEANLSAALAAVQTIGYKHVGDMGVKGRHANKHLATHPIDPDAFETAPRPAFGPGQESCRRNLYVCVDGCLAVRNHLGVRDVLRANPGLRNEYAATKLRLASDPTMEIPEYLEGKSDILLRVLAMTGNITEEEKAEIAAINKGPTASARLASIAPQPGSK